MDNKITHHLEIVGARTNNLSSVNLKIPHEKLIVITGVSGSGKSSLAFDTIAKEGQRRYFETLPSFARQFIGKISQPLVDSIDGLSPVITVGQKIAGDTNKSTVGTLSDIDGWMRLLFARFSSSNTSINPTRSLFSPNTKEGMCIQCKGLGKEEKIDLKKLVHEPSKSLKQGALAPTLPTGYIMYSQVTIDVLELVCQAEGFDTNTPWNELSLAHQEIILYGSQKIKVPFGKHSLESRLKWTGMKAKPREEGYYKGMIPIMSDILKRDRNPNILKYVSAVVCSSCNGHRLNQNALSFKIAGKSIQDVNQLELNELKTWIDTIKVGVNSTPILKKISALINQLSIFGLGHLKLCDSGKTCSLSEIQRIRLTNQLNSDLSGVIYVFDEPSIGLHKSENQIMINAFKNLVRKGNTVIIVEHDIETIQSADWIVELGPGAGKNGGHILFNGSLNDFLKTSEIKSISPTYKAIHNEILYPKKHELNSRKTINLTNGIPPLISGLSFSFKQGQLNTISGKASRTKSALIQYILPAVFKEHHTSYFETVKADLPIDKVIHINQTPIGRTPRSNPSTYLGISEHIRDLLARQTKAKELNLKKSHFSFNTKGGRCESCEGAGKKQIGIHFLGKIDIICGTCNGNRFNATSLAVTYKEKSIADIYNLSVNEAALLFKDEVKIMEGLNLLNAIGLGYLSLGQPSSTLSGGEAQRIKIANELQQKTTGHTVYILDEPSLGLHPQDLKDLLGLFQQILNHGHTIICFDQDDVVLDYSNHVVNLEDTNQPHQINKSLKNIVSNSIELKGVRTHLLKNIDIEFPKNKLSVVTGLSGSGKSSLVFDTLYSRAASQFSESLSLFNRSKLKHADKAELDYAIGITPSIALKQDKKHGSNRSTIGTLSEISNHFRLLYSRIAALNGKNFTAQHFSFNHKLGACSVCKGLGTVKSTDEKKIIQDPTKSIFNGALTTNKSIKYYTNLSGQFIAILRHIEKQKKWNLNRPWNELSKEQQKLIWYGTGEKKWELEWDFSTKTKTGKQQLSAEWKGFINYVNEEYDLKKDAKKKPSLLLELLKDSTCSTCNGTRLKKILLSTTFLGLNIHEIGELEIQKLHSIISTKDLNSSDKELIALYDHITPPILQITTAIIELGLGYLSLNRRTNTLSGGELQRIQLTGQLAANLYGVTYILDEPTRGLDDKQNEIIIRLLKKLIKKGNTVIVIEHNPLFISKADYLVEMGPGTGKQGGEIVFKGSPKQLSQNPHTITHQLLTQTPSQSNKTLTTDKIKFGVTKANKNNLQHLDITLYKNQTIVIKGVSGSGKSTLLKEVLYPSFSMKSAVNCETVFGEELFDNIHFIDQSPLDLTTLSTPASYTGILDQLKTIYSKSEHFSESGLKKGDFSYTSKQGKCETCSGYGQVKTNMDFMSDLWTPCETCKSLRYNQSVLSYTIKWKHQLLSIGSLLKKTAAELLELSTDQKLNKKLHLFIQLGIGHLQLGQSGNNLSGGENQRLKLAKHIINGSKNDLYLFDEPSNGLHYFDLINLISVFNELTSAGNTIVFIEHNKQLIESANHSIELGPGSGKQGGKLIFSDKN